MADSNPGSDVAAGAAGEAAAAGADRPGIEAGSPGTAEAAGAAGAAGADGVNPGIKVLPAAFDTEPLGIGVPNDEPQFEAFVNTWLKGIEANGTWTKLWKDTIGTAITGTVPAPPKVA